MYRFGSKSTFRKCSIINDFSLIYKADRWPQLNAFVLLFIKDLCVSLFYLTIFVILSP